MTDLVNNGKKPNVRPESNSWKDDVFVNRFHLSDPEFGKADTSVVDSEGNLTPRLLRMAKRIELRITTQNSRADKIYIPLITITYRDVTVPQQASPTLGEASVDFAVSQPSFRLTGVVTGTS